MEVKQGNSTWASGTPHLVLLRQHQCRLIFVLLNCLTKFQYTPPYIYTHVLPIHITYQIAEITVFRRQSHSG